jgi:hypothetical protein
MCMPGTNYTNSWNKIVVHVGTKYMISRNKISIYLEGFAGTHRTSIYTPTTNYINF